MRIVRVDLTGTTDGNGNATIKVPLPFTGAWYNVKFPLSLSGPAEWAILVSGTPFTYGRGRRVTLGPELIQDGETVTVSVTGGPPNAAITGSMNGSAGYPEEILASYTPAPNTIAVDASTGIQLLGTVTDSSTHTFPLPAGAVCVGYRAKDSTITSVQIVGVQSGDVYFLDSASNVSVAPVSTLLDQVDTSVNCTATPATSAHPCDFMAWTLPTFLFVQQRPGLAGIFTVQEGSAPPFWQAPNLAPVEFGATIAGGATLALIAAVANQSVYLFALNMDADNVAGTAVTLEDTAGTAYHRYGSTSSVVPGPALFAGSKLPSGVGVRLHNIGGVGVTVQGSLVASQG